MDSLVTLDVGRETVNLPCPRPIVPINVSIGRNVEYDRDAASQLLSELEFSYRYIYSTKWRGCFEKIGYRIKPVANLPPFVGCDIFRDPSSRPTALDVLDQVTLYAKIVSVNAVKVGEVNDMKETEIYLMKLADPSDEAANENSAAMLVVFDPTNEFIQQLRTGSVGQFFLKDPSYLFMDERLTVVFTVIHAEIDIPTNALNARINCHEAMVNSYMKRKQEYAETRSKGLHWRLNNNGECCYNQRPSNAVIKEMVKSGLDTVSCNPWLALFEDKNPVSNAHRPLRLKPGDFPDLTEAMKKFTIDDVNRNSKAKIVRKVYDMEAFEKSEIVAWKRKDITFMNTLLKEKNCRYPRKYVPLDRSKFQKDYRAEPTQSVKAASTQAT